MAFVYKINNQVVHPIGFEKIEGNFEEETYQFNITVDKVTIGNDQLEYNLLMGIENDANSRCQMNTFTIEKSGSIIYLGQFKMNDCKFFPNECKIEIKLSQDNNERCIRDRWQNEHNILEDPGETITGDTDNFTVFVYNDPAYDGLNRRLDADGAPTAADYVTAGADPGDQPYIQVDKINPTPINEDGDDYNYYVAYQYRKTILQPGTGCPATIDSFDYLDSVSVGGNIYCIYAKLPPNDALSSSSSVVMDLSNPGPGWNLITASPVPATPNRSWYRDRITSYTNTRARDFIGVIENMLVFLCSDVDVVESSFFQDSTNPISGETNYFNNMKFVQISDFIDPVSSQPATRGMISFQNLMYALRTKFDVFWWTAGNKLRIEHRSYLMNLGIGLDMTTEHSKNLSYSYEGDLPGAETFKFPVSQSEDWIDHQIQYIDSSGNVDGCVDENSVDLVVPEISTDVEYLVQLPEVGRKGLVLLACNSDNEIIKIPSDTTGLTYLNYPLSWRYLITRFHKENRSGLEGELNGIPITFNSIKPAKKLKELIKTNFCTSDYVNFDPLELVQTQYGSAMIKKFVYNAKHETLRLELWQ